MVLLGFQGLYAKVKIFKAPSKGIKLIEAVTSWIASHRLAMGENKDIDSRSEYAHSEKLPNSSLTYILH